MDSETNTVINQSIIPSSKKLAEERDALKGGEFVDEKGRRVYRFVLEFSSFPFSLSPSLADLPSLSLSFSFLTELLLPASLSPLGDTGFQEA